ncbi:unnamed protein product [Adineta steineri]|uniref:RRM domain-containing protein n=1 Tax=Adineta steineri TaxID=433720 RepID=A0A816EZX9_9BILA|nr:unnamed protein product [Adineta steineri]CAF1656298.1 unnamed protein product [Adineta steineri]
MGDLQVFIGNLCNISTDVLRTYCEQYGSLIELSVNRNKDNDLYHCFAFVTFQFPRSISQFMSHRPHSIDGEEIFVKRTLPRSASTIAERLITTNRLISHDLSKYNKNLLQNYFQKYGNVKKIDIENDYIDFDDYDDVDRVLLARPHYIRDKEISVTKFFPSEQQDNSENHHICSNHRQRLTTNSGQSFRISRTSSTESMTHSNIETLGRNTSIKREWNSDDDDDDDEQEGRIDCNYSSAQYEHLEEQFYEYKQAKEIEIAALKMDLEHTKHQLIDIMEEKFDLLIKNQELYHKDLLIRLSSNNTSMYTEATEDSFQSTPNHSAKKRKSTRSPSLSPISSQYDSDL